MLGGNTVYTEAITNYLEGQARRVSIEVYDDVVPGDGQMYIVGELKPNYKSIASQIENQDEVTGTLPIGQVLDQVLVGNIPDEFIEGIQSQNQQDVPDEFQDVYNVRFVRPVFIIQHYQMNNQYSFTINQE